MSHARHTMSKSFIVITAISGALLILDTACIALLLIIRKRTGQLGWDDWLTLAAFGLACGAYMSGVLDGAPKLGLAGNVVSDAADPITIVQQDMWAEVSQSFHVAACKLHTVESVFMY